MTFDPSLRLKDALGRCGRPPSRRPKSRWRPGRLCASLLDARTTFDRLIDRYAPDQRARAHPAYRFYDNLWGILAGVLEYMASERLFRGRARRGARAEHPRQRRRPVRRWTSSGRPTASFLPRLGRACGSPSSLVRRRRPASAPPRASARSPQRRGPSSTAWSALELLREWPSAFRPSARSTTVSGSAPGRGAAAAAGRPTRCFVLVSAPGRQPGRRHAVLRRAGQRGRL